MVISCLALPGFPLLEGNYFLSFPFEDVDGLRLKRKVTSEQGGTSLQHDPECGEQGGISLQHDPECGGALAGWRFRLKTLLVSTWKMDTGGQLASLCSGGVQTQS